MQEDSQSDDKDLHNLEPLLSKDTDENTTQKDITIIPLGRRDNVCQDKISPDMRPVHRKPPTSFAETLIHLVKGNLGGGAFAMGEAFKHAGLLLGPLLTIVLGFICIYGNHILVNCSELIRTKKKLAHSPSFPETVELCFENGPSAFRKWTPVVRLSIKAFIIITQLGFCCVYFVFVSSTANTIMASYNIKYDVRVYMAVMFLPVLLSCFIRTLKFLTPVSLLSNVCLISGIVFTLYLSCSDLPPVSSRRLFSTWDTFPLFFGTVIYSFEGISLVVPLKNEMKEPEKFGKPLGVLNLGMVIIMAILLTMGSIGYLQYGDDVKGSLSLNLPPSSAYRGSCRRFSTNWRGLPSLLFVYEGLKFVEVNLDTIQCNSDNHRYSTRFCNDLCPPAVRLTTPLKSDPLQNGIRLYNKLPLNIRELPTVTFSRCLKSKLIKPELYMMCLISMILLGDVLCPLFAMPLGFFLANFYKKFTYCV